MKRHPVPSSSVEQPVGTTCMCHDGQKLKGTTDMMRKCQLHSMHTFCMWLMASSRMTIHCCKFWNHLPIRLAIAPMRVVFMRVAAEMRFGDVKISHPEQWAIRNIESAILHRRDSLGRHFVQIATSCHIPACIGK